MYNCWCPLCKPHCAPIYMMDECVYKAFPNVLFSHVNADDFPMRQAKNSFKRLPQSRTPCCKCSTNEKGIIRDQKANACMQHPLFP